MCKSNTKQYSWKDFGGLVDYYVIIGDGFNELIDLYTDLTGKPKLPPEWSFGLWYICRTQANDHEVMSDALNFRREGIPCDVIGLEPGWMEKDYDYSIDKEWSKERFPIPKWVFNGPYNFIDALKRMGYKIELWLCNNYDLTYEEERKLGNTRKADNQYVVSDANPNYVEIDQHLSKPVLFDEITKKDEAWFEHLKKFVDQGVDFFKQDAATQVLDHPDRLWGNGMPDKEVHNLYPLLYARQMYEGFENYTGKRPVVYTPCGWAGIQAWAGTWTGDTGGRLTSLGGLINTSIVGHSWSTTDMEVTQKEGIHFGYLQPRSQIVSWYYFRMPWLQGTELTNMHKYYARLRQTLIPYLYSWAYNATQTGWPLLRPLTLEFPEDKNCRNNLHQYFLGRDLMVGIYNAELYFPKGKWKDYWTGKVVDGDGVLKVTWPDNRGGALYIRSGAIIPFGPEMQYWGEKTLNEISLYVFPDVEESEFNLYEDDGTSMNHLHGEYSITPISTVIKGNKSIIRIEKTSGGYEGKVKDREWSIVSHAPRKPNTIRIHNEPLEAGKYSWDDIRNEITIKGIISPAVIEFEY